MTPSSNPSLQDVIQLVEVENHQPLSRLSAASALVRDMAEVGDAALGYFVDQARHAGHSWSEIGEALGVSKQAAQQKHVGRVSLGLKGPTFQRFTPRARNVLSAAEPIARNLGHAYIGTEHLLLALYREPEGLAAQILVESDLPAEEAEAAVSQRTERGGSTPEGNLSFTAKAISMFSAALASALELGHNYIGTEHLLLGLVQGDGLAAEVLEGAGLSEQVLTAKVTEKLAVYGQASQAVKRTAKRAAARTGTSAVRKARAAKPAPR
jgi:Clp amino terminal domain, pathogenicity island component